MCGSHALTICTLETNTLSGEAGGQHDSRDEIDLVCDSQKDECASIQRPIQVEIEKAATPSEPTRPESISANVGHVEEEASWTRVKGKRHADDRQAATEAVTRGYLRAVTDGNSQCGQISKISFKVQGTDHSKHQGFSYASEKALSSSCWTGKKRQQCRRQGPSKPLVGDSHSLGEESGSFSLAQRLQELIDVDSRNNARSAEYAHRYESDQRPRNIFLAQRLQELLDTDPLSYMPLKKSKAQPSDRKGYDFANKSGSTSNALQSHIDDDILESAESDDDDDSQIKSFEEKGLPETEVKSTPNILKQLQGALECVPYKPNTTFTARQRNVTATSGFSTCLQSTLADLKVKQEQFANTLTLDLSVHGHSQCLLASIIAKKLEAQFTRCQCKLLPFPQDHMDMCGTSVVAGVNWEQDCEKAEIVFSLKTNPDLELEIGGLVHIHPPWEELVGIGKFGRVLLCTYFCET